MGRGGFVGIFLKEPQEFEQRGSAVKTPSWSCAFTPDPSGASSRTVLPLSSFRASWHGRRMPDAAPLADAPEGVRTVGLLLNHVRGPNRRRFGEGDHEFGVTVERLEWLQSSE